MTMKAQIKWKNNAISGNIAGTLKPTSRNIPRPFGTPRPIQHYRRGRVVDGDMSRLVNSNQHYTVKNIIDNPSSVNISDTCLGLKVEGNYYPNETFKHDKPYCHNNNNTEFSKRFNPENKALQRVRSAPTVLKKTYHQSNASYLKSKCKTFEQNAFHFDELDMDVKSASNMFRPKCNGVTCESVSYNPKNKLFSTNNAVDSSTYTFHKKMEAKKENYNKNTFKNAQNINISPNACGKSLQRNRQYKTLHINNK